MYIAGRLRTASRPPRTLIEVASYLCPAAFADGVSLSPMDRASPQCVRQTATACERIHARVVRQSCVGKAVERKCATLALPIGPALARDANSSWDSKGVSRLHPTPHRNLGGARRRSSISPSGRGCPAALLPRDFRLARSRQAPYAGKPQAEQSAVQEDSGTPEFTGREGNSQADSEATNAAHLQYSHNLTCG